MGLIVSYGATVAAFLYRRLQRGAALAALLLLPSVSACGGSGQPVPGTLPQHASAPLAPDAAMRETQSESALMPAAPFVAGPNDLLYVANAGNNSITVYHTGASGNTAPLATIEGSKTGLESPGQLSEDQNGNLYVANQYHAEPPESILVFKHGANGNVAPIRAIAGPATRLSTNDLAAIAVDPAGRIFATMGLPSDEGSADLVRFAPDASGNVAPLATSRGGEDLDDANELAFDSTGKNIIEANGPVCCEVFSEGVNTYSKQFPNGKNASLIYSISAFTSNGIADDPTTKTYPGFGRRRGFPRHLSLRRKHGRAWRKQWRGHAAVYARSRVGHHERYLRDAIGTRLRAQHLRAA